MDLLRVIVSWDGDAIGQKVGRACRADDIEEVRRVDQAINRGNDIWRSWTLRHSGSVVEIGGDEGRVEVPAAALAELEAIRQQYSGAVDATVSVGVGRKLSESAKALLAAKLRGKDRVVLYDQSVETDIKNAEQPTEQEKIRTEYLGDTKTSSSEAGPDELADRDGETDIAKAEEPSKKAHAEAKAPNRQTDEHSEGEVAEKAAAVPGGGKAAIARAHAAAGDQDKRDRASSARKSGDLDQLRAQCATALNSMRSQLPVMAQLKSAYPQTYQSVVQLVQSVISLGRELQQADTTLEKHERAPKMWRTNTGFSDDVQIPSIDHPQRQQFEQNYRAKMAGHFANGDVRALKPLTVQVADLEPSHLVVGKPERTKLYRQMARQDRLLPILIHRQPSGRFKVIDGNRRHEAAKATGLTELPAYEVVARRMTKAAGDFKPEQPEFDTTKATDQGYLEQYAQPWQHRITQIDPGHAQREWHYESAVPTAAIHGHGSYKAYLDDERKDAIKSGYAQPGEDHFGHLTSWLHAPHRQPLVLFEHSDGRLLPADGSHRLGVAEEAGVEQVPAIVARLKTAKTELEPEEAPPSPRTLDKATMPPHAKSHRSAPLPVGTIHNGEVKVRHADGQAGWKGVRAGQIQGLEADAPMVGANSHPVSSREPGSR